MPLISVIIPAYNAEKTIKETIKSVLNQTISDFEILVINDGSQDGTVEIVESITDSRIKLFSYPNAGPQKTRNRGIHHASGDYIALLDADDRWTPDKLASQLKALQDNPQAAVAYSWTDYIDESDQFLRPGPHIHASGDIFPQLLLADCIGSGSNPLIRQQALAEVGNFDESLPAAQDWEMWLRLAARYPFVVVPEVQVFYRISGNSWSSNVYRMEAASWQVIEKVFANAPESIQQLKKDTIANRYKSLTFRTLEGTANRTRALTGIHFLTQAVKNDPSLLRRRVTWKILVKIGIILLLPSQLTHTLLTKVKALSNIEALLFHIRTNPS